MMFLAIEINLVLWLAVVASLFANPSDASLARTAAVAGCALAAVFQHWGYYNIRKKPS